MAIKHINDSEFQQEISEGVVVVDLWAPWCGPCKMIAPILEELEQELGDQAKILKLNVDENQETAKNYDVMSIPTLLVFKNGTLVDKTVGFQPKEAFKALIDKYI